MYRGYFLNQEILNQNVSLKKIQALKRSLKKF